jgi:hypothetical protein
LQKGRREAGPLVSANVEPKPRLHPYRTRPGFDGGTAISENYFVDFAFFFFFAMMKSSDVWTG